MSKTWDTKKKIIKLLSKNHMTVTEISSTLNLAPSTVSKHVEELNRIGAIRLIENEHIKKWKYYTVNPEFNSNNFVRGYPPMTVKVAQLAIAAVIVIAGLFILLSLSGKHQSQYQYVSFQLTDPPQVPSGTNALVVTYSSLAAHVSGQGNNTGAWISSNSTGSVDLLTLVNSSLVIGEIKVPENTSINMINFTVSNAMIEINNTYYNVTVPRDIINTTISGGETLNGNASVLMDFSPSIVTLFSSNSTAYVMVPSIRAVILGSNASTKIGSKSGLSNQDINKLHETGPSLRISSATLSSLNANTSLSVTVTNNGSSSLDITHVLVYGSFIADFYRAMNVSAGILPDPQVRPSFDALVNDSIQGSVPSTVNNITHGTEPQIGVEGKVINSTGGSLSSSISATAENLGTQDKDSVNTSESITPSLNPNVTLTATSNQTSTVASANENLTVTIGVNKTEGIVSNTQINSRSSLGTNINVPIQTTKTLDSSKLVTTRNLNSLDLLVESNGSLIVSSSENGAVHSGFILGPGQSATFTFSGQLLLYDNSILLTPLNGSSYNLVIEGDNGLSIGARVTT